MVHFLSFLFSIDYLPFFQTVIITGTFHDQAARYLIFSSVGEEQEQPDHHQTEAQRERVEEGDPAEVPRQD